MYVTEEEAKQKWCPHHRVRHYSESEPVRNGPMIGTAVAVNEAINGNRCRCIASGCMMWRWSALAMDRARTGVADVDKGYCGLAGRPE